MVNFAFNDFDEMGRCQGHILKRVAEGKSDRVLDVVLRVRSPRRSPLRAS